MEEYISLEQKENYAICHYQGPYRLAELLEIIKPVIDYCHQHNLNRILVDITKSIGDPDFIDRYDHGVEMEKRWDRRIRLAVLLREDQKTPDKFWELVTKNRGIPSRVFTEMELALKWLMD